MNIFFDAMELWDDYAGRFSNPLQAIKLLSKTILLNPKIETAYHFRGFAYSQLNKFDLAIEDYNQTIRLKPDDARVYNNWGNAYAGLGQHQRAIEFEESKAIGRHPDRDK
jgi:Tfp pilus assembly protein PilF